MMGLTAMSALASLSKGNFSVDAIEELLENFGVKISAKEFEVSKAPEEFKALTAEPGGKAVVLRASHPKGTLSGIFFIKES